jgi:hypothetical protein
MTDPRDEHKYPFTHICAWCYTLHFGYKKCIRCGREPLFELDKSGVYRMMMIRTSLAMPAFARPYGQQHPCPACARPINDHRASCRFIRFRSEHA